VTTEQARQHLASFLPRVRAGYPWTMSDTYGSNATVKELRAVLLGDLGKPLSILLGAVGLVLLIACVNDLSSGRVSQALSRPRFTAALLVVFAALVLLLGMVGCTASRPTPSASVPARRQSA
jgi:uncharacterized membrane protein